MAHEPACDIYGRPLAVTCRWNGRACYARTPEWQRHDRLSTPERSMLAELRRLVAAEIARYRLDGSLSAKELRTVEALWRGGQTLREHARREGVSPQAIEARIHGMRTRAVRFWRWWRRKHLMRGRR
jgi:hypothetical protein